MRVVSVFISFVIFLYFVGFTLDITSQANGWLCGRSCFHKGSTNNYFLGNVVTGSKLFN